MDLDIRIKAYKLIAYSAIAFSVVALLSVSVSLPIVYKYVQHVRQRMGLHLNHCKVCTKLVCTC